MLFSKDLSIKRVVSWVCGADGSHSERPSKAAWGRNTGDSTHQRISLGAHQGEVGQESVHWGDHLRPHCQLGGSPCSMTVRCICLQMLAVFPDDAVLLANVNYSQMMMVVMITSISPYLLITSITMLWLVDDILHRAREPVAGGRPNRRMRKVAKMVHVQFNLPVKEGMVSVPTIRYICVRWTVILCKPRGMLLPFPPPSYSNSLFKPRQPSPLFMSFCADTLL
jgi:hypothetical protein